MSTARTAYLCASCRAVEVVFPADLCEVCIEETRFDGVDSYPTWFRTEGAQRARMRAVAR